MVLEDEEESFEPVGVAGSETLAGDVESWAMVGRFLMNKLIKLEYMRQVLASVWQPVKGVQVSELQPNLFLFVFYHVTDMQQVLNEGPWSFENNSLVCRQVRDGVLPVDVVLDSIDMWVQFHDLPMGYTSDSVLEQIGNFLGVFIKCDDRFAGVPWRSFYHVRVSIPVDKPIKRRMRLVKRDKSTCWVTFKYERLHNFCFYCGYLGHSYKFCLKARESPLSVSQYPYDASLRAGGSRGPHAVGERWLVPAEGPSRPSGTGVVAPAPAAVEVMNHARVEEGVVAVSKRRREGPSGGRRSGGAGRDIVMQEVSKNLSMAGSGPQTRPSS
ncbi:uncharacterized protein LOC116020362 [Ipomoea triloba]|uniref:uncharacterized protein LOC116020362 n=1 Tax=Ipomoea triloba TaxID=35885 RepID=UPI00125D3375|nr:uncharacterized protein LOC116020362 [Ipomoea triloba]